MKPLRIPVEAYLEPAVIVCAPGQEADAAAASEAEAEDPWLDEVRARLEPIVSLHSDPIDVRIYDEAVNPGAARMLAEWLEGISAALGPGRSYLAVTTTEVNIRPRAGLWAVLLAALTVAHGTGGRILDFEGLRELKRDSAIWSPALTGSLAVALHTSLLFSCAPRGRALVGTRGLGKFGLPELHLQGPAEEVDAFTPLLLGVAQVLAELALAAVAGRPEYGRLATELVLPFGWVGLDAGAVGRANGRPGWGGPGFKVGLSYTAPAGGRPPRLTIVEPRSATARAGWLREAVEALGATPAG